jgi:fructose-1,6-bisphosphatase
VTILATKNLCKDVCILVREVYGHKVTLVVINAHTRHLFKTCQQPFQILDDANIIIQEQNGIISVLEANNPTRDNPMEQTFDDATVGCPR